MSAVAKKNASKSAQTTARKSTTKKTTTAKAAAAKRPAPAKKTAQKPLDDQQPAAKKVSKKPAKPAALALIKKTLKLKKGEDIKVLDLRGISSVADFLVLCTGRTIPHLDALANETIKALRAATPARAPHKRAGIRQSQWMVLDYVDIVVHLFTPEFRSYYALEDLWKDAPTL